MSPSYVELAESFMIFDKYSSRVQLAAEHDQIWAGPDADVVLEADRRRLESLGWQPAPEGGWYRFT